RAGRTQRVPDRGVRGGGGGGQAVVGRGPRGRDLVLGGVGVALGFGGRRRAKTRLDLRGEQPAEVVVVGGVVDARRSRRGPGDELILELPGVRVIAVADQRGAGCPAGFEGADLGQVGVRGRLCVSGLVRGDLVEQVQRGGVAIGDVLGRQATALRVGRFRGQPGCRRVVLVDGPGRAQSAAL